MTPVLGALLLIGTECLHLGSKSLKFIKWVKNVLQFPSQVHLGVGGPRERPEEDSPRGMGVGRGHYTSGVHGVGTCTREGVIETQPSFTRGTKTLGGGKVASEIRTNLGVLCSDTGCFLV